MNYMMIAMIGRVMVLVGVLVPMLFIKDLNQTSPVNLAFWAITVFGIGILIYGRIGETKERHRKMEAAARKDRVEVDLDDEV